MGQRRLQRDRQHEQTARFAEALRTLDPVDRQILAYERAGVGPHHVEVGISVAEYEARLARLADDPATAVVAPGLVERRSARDGGKVV
jgi:hypothetical protein